MRIFWSTSDRKNLSKQLKYEKENCYKGRRCSAISAAGSIPGFRFRDYPNIKATAEDVKKIQTKVEGDLIQKFTKEAKTPEETIAWTLALQATLLEARDRLDELN